MIALAKYCFKWHSLVRNYFLIENISVGRCVILCAIFGKSVKHTFLVEKCILLKKKDVYKFSFAF